MQPINTNRTIDAPLEVVFEAISDVRNFCEAVPHITHIEFLSDQRTGVGTRFRETRSSNGRTQTVELEVTEYFENSRVRMVSDAGGTLWDTLFTVEPASHAIELTMSMEVKPYRLFAKLFSPLIRSAVVKGVEADMDALKVYCESR